MDDKSRQNEQILNILSIYTHAGTISAPVANQHSSALNWNVFSHSRLLLHERVFAHLPHFAPIYQFGQITLKRPFWCRPMVLLRASTLKHSARLSTQILSLSQGLRITVLFFFFLLVFGAFLLSVPEHLQDKKLGLPPWHPPCGTALSATPASLAQCVCTENRGTKQLHKHLWGMFHSHSYYVKSQAQRELQFSLCQTSYCAFINGGIIYFVTVWWGSGANVPLIHMLPSEPFWGTDLKMCIF